MAYENQLVVEKTWTCCFSIKNCHFSTENCRLLTENVRFPIKNAVYENIQTDAGEDFSCRMNSSKSNTQLASVQTNNVKHKKATSL